MDFLNDTYTWIIFSFVVFVFIGVKFGLPVLTQSLDQKIKAIRDEVQAAERLKAEANALLIEFEQRQRDAEREADALVAQARENAEQIRLREEDRLHEMMQRKEQQLTERINLLRDQTITELRQIAADLAFAATTKMVEQKMDSETRNRLIDRALEQVQQKLN